jgi:hypothetical protein
VADCTRITSMAPAQGFEVHDRESREGEFRSTANGRDRVEVELYCDGGVPRLVVTRDDD